MADEVDNIPDAGMSGDDEMHDVIPVSGMYENWFLDYASYVILERAVPAIQDGLKPVQRRILHSMKEKDDGRFNKIANIIGHTMQYHPHGDAAIGDAVVNLGQKDLLIETQGNWGDIRTGDSAAAPRYIEGRLSKFANHVVFNPQTTEWQASYDGRNKEPITLPVKFPLLLAQGVEGIAVGLATKIMPHNFIELIEGSIKILKGKKTNILPDFPTGGLADFSQYNHGLRGGKIRVRARIEEVDKKNLAIREIPFNTTTSSLIDSIIKANDNGKIKIKKVVDNTAKDVEILVTMPSGVSPDVMIDALYAFTDCEVSISPNACVIIDEKPHFMSVDDILKVCTDNTVSLLKQELEIRKGELMEKILFSSLEKIFIENRIYRDIEECETWEAVIDTIDKGLDPYKPQFYREIKEEDIVRLTEIKIKRISRFDSFKADELMRKLEEELKEVEHNLKNLTDYAIAYYQGVLDKFGKGKERKTEIRTFDTIQATQVVANNAKLYMNAKEGFIGTGLRKDEFVCDCSDIDDIIVFRRDGRMVVSKIADKVFVGKNIIFAGVFKKGDERMVYNMAYVNGDNGKSYVKRFQVLGVTRDKEYEIGKGKGAKVHYFTANPNGEAETVTVYLTAGSTARKKVFEFDFADIEIKGRGAGGNILTKYPVRKVELKSAGVSTLSGVDIWYDEVVGRLNREERGKLLGQFNGEDKIVVIHKDGSYELTSFELTNRYEPNSVLVIDKYDPKKVISAIHMDGESGTYYVKRFQIETSTDSKKFPFINESKGSKLILATTADAATIEMSHKSNSKGAQKKTTELQLEELIDVKGWKAIGNKLTNDRVYKVTLKEEKFENKTESPEKESDDDNETESSTPTQPVTEQSKPEHKKEEEKEQPTAQQKSEEKKDAPEKDADVDIGSTIELDVKPKKSEKKDKGNDDKEQLGLF